MRLFSDNRKFIAGYWFNKCVCYMFYHCFLVFNFYLIFCEGTSFFFKGEEKEEKYK